jgi:hypothetical protein
MRYGIALLLLGGCIFIPPMIEYNSYLAGRTAQAGAERYIVEEDGVVTYSLSGLRVRVEYLTDEALNQEFPDDSDKGQFSTNPYTYGDWIDPVLGYRPNRFTVFQITVSNDTYAKVLLDPIVAELHTDRGEILHSFGIPSYSRYESFERYYRGIRGQSGNEFYRFDTRLGNVRSSAYLEDTRVFKGESYSGLLAFVPLDEEVDQVQLILEDFVLKFDASGQPIETVDILFDFDRHIDKTVVTQEADLQK